MKKKLLLLIIIPILLAADQATKYWAMNWLQFNGPVDVIDGVFQFRYLTNYGAAWGMFENQILFFLITTILTVALLAFIYFRIPPVKKYIPFRLIVLVIISGAIGNLIDRVVFGFVIDFLYFELIDFPIFNVADIYVTVSAFILAYLFIFHYKDDEFTFLSLQKDNRIKASEETKNEQ